MARILVVDDSTIARRNLKTILTRAGHTIVAEAENGEQAYREYEKHRPDLTTMDISMPLLDGVAAVKKIISVHPEAAIIMVSAIDQRSMVMAAIENGARHYIVKPFSAEKVLASIDTVLATPPASIDAKVAEKKPVIDKSQQRQMKEPFTIENKQGVFIIMFSQSFGTAQIPELGNTIQAFLYVKPLRVVFDFGPISIHEYSILDELILIMDKIKKAGGMVKVAADDAKIVRFIKNNGFEAE